MTTGSSGWRPDPWGHQRRFFDGEGWTDLVADDGIHKVDPAPRDAAPPRQTPTSPTPPSGVVDAVAPDPAVEDRVTSALQPPPAAAASRGPGNGLVLPSPPRPRRGSRPESAPGAPFLRDVEPPAAPNGPTFDQPVPLPTSPPLGTPPPVAPPRPGTAPSTGALHILSEERTIRMWQILALIVAALLLGLVLGRATSGASSAAPRTATTVRFTTTSTVGHTAEPVPASAITPTTSPGKSLTASGSGDNLSKPFSFAANWQLAWTFTCSQGAGSPFQLVVLDSGQHPVTPSQKISTVGRSGSGTRLYAPGAMLSLQITTPCGWTVRLSGQSG